VLQRLTLLQLIQSVPYRGDFPLGHFGVQRLVRFNTACSRRQAMVAEALTLLSLDPMTIDLPRLA
jgi:hypothetical protein